MGSDSFFFLNSGSVRPGAGFAGVAPVLHAAHEQLALAKEAERLLARQPEREPAAAGRHADEPFVAEHARRLGEARALGLEPAVGRGDLDLGFGPVDAEVAEICAAAAARFAGPSDWLQIAAVITLTACPALSRPCGFTGADRPVGLQLVGRPHGEAVLLAAALEAVLKLPPRTPIDPRSPAGAAILSAAT